MSVPGEPSGLVPNWDRGPRQRHDVKPCGTEAAAARHRRAGERPCTRCLDAEKRAHAFRARERRAAAAERRAADAA